MAVLPPCVQLTNVHVPLMTSGTLDIITFHYTCTFISPAIEFIIIAATKFNYSVPKVKSLQNRRVLMKCLMAQAYPCMNTFTHCYNISLS